MAPAPTPSSLATTSRWGVFRLSSLAGAAAVLVAAFQFQHTTKNQAVEDKTSETIYCYQGVKTEALAPQSLNSDDRRDVNCFGVSQSTGRFTRLYEDTTSLYSPAVERRKGYVLPGLWDGHGHLMQYGEFLHSADLFGSNSFDEIRSRLRDYLDRTPGSGTRDNWSVSFFFFRFFLYTLHSYLIFL